MIKTALLCLALTVFHESRGEPLKGQYAVAEVVMNRSVDRNLDVCSVVYEHGQFSNATKWKIPSDKDKSWNKALFIAQDVLDSNNATNYTNGATYFRVASLAPKNKQVLRIGNHVFF